jgi:uncharacterized protein (TIGR02001 family)
MNRILKNILTVTALSASIAAQADLTANAGFVSDYYFRGANLGDGGAYGGIDYEVNGFYLGTWIIDDQAAGNDGLETDFYLGYSTDFSELVSLSVGYSRYEYTYSSDFEHEVTLNLSVGAFGLEYTSGEDEDLNAPKTDYDYTAVSWSGDVFGLTYGDFDNSDTDTGYAFIELSATGEVSGLDATISFGNQIDAENNGISGNTGDGYIVLDISKKFNL